MGAAHLGIVARAWVSGFRRGRISLLEIARFVPRSAVIVEAGAHVGTDTESFARFWPQATIHAFEPIGAIFAQLEQRMNSHSNVHCYRFAVSDREGSAPMFVSSGGSDGSSSLLPPKEILEAHPDVSFDEDEMVATVTLDEWAERTGVQHVDLLWLDLQGGELKALSGGERMLESVRAIHTEVNLIESYEGTPSFHELREWLEQRAFFVARTKLAWSDGGNVLFVRRGSM